MLYSLKTPIYQMTENACFKGLNIKLNIGFACHTDYRLCPVAGC